MIQVKKNTVDLNVSMYVFPMFDEQLSFLKTIIS